MFKSAAGPGSSRSRTSLDSLGRMPIIAEDEDTLAQALPPHRHRRSASGGRRDSFGSYAAATDASGQPTVRPTSFHGNHPAPYPIGGPTGMAAGYSNPQDFEYQAQLPPYPPPAYYRRQSEEGASPEDSRTADTRGGNASATGNGSAGVATAAAATAAAPSSRGRRQSVPGGEPDRSPPSNDEMGAMEKIKQNPWFARRGGWCRICVIVGLVLALVIGLAVGLGIGLQKNSSSSDDDSPPSPSSSSPAFPAGSFAFRTALTDISTSCTANNATWRCYPYMTYAETLESSSDSLPDAVASYYWTIAPPDPDVGRDGYAVSSADNPFAPRFGNASMTKHGEGTPDERLEFELNMERTVVPGGPVAEVEDSADGNGSGDGVSCEFQTIFKGTVWTGAVEGGSRNRTTIRDASGDSSDDDADSDDEDEAYERWGVWPGEVEILQISLTGPECMDVSGNTVRVGDGDGECLCRYANYDLDDPGSSSSSSSSSSTRSRSIDGETRRRRLERRLDLG